MKKWPYVTKDEPCKACGKPDWCKSNGEHFLCKRTSDPPAGYEVNRREADCTIFKPKRESTPQAARKSKMSNPIRQEVETRDWGAEAKQFQDDLPKKELDSLAHELGVSADALRKVGIGAELTPPFARSPGGDPAVICFTFPEENGLRKVIGIATRQPDGEKKSIKGSKRGLTIPIDLKIEDGTVCLIVEGATDVAAAITVGLNVVGRPSNKTGIDHLVQLFADSNATIIVLGENDRKNDEIWPGREGAEKTAEGLANKLQRSVSWALPPEGIKDFRDWLQHLNKDIEDEKAVGAEILKTIEESSIIVEADDLPRSVSGDDQKSQSTLLIELVLAQEIELFHTPGGADSEGFASVITGDVRDTMRLNSKSFKHWASRLFYMELGKAPNGRSLADAIGTLSARAIFDGSEHQVCTRVAGTEDAIFVDLCSADGHVVRIDRDGWNVLSSASVPVRFIRKYGMLPLPHPEQDGSLEDFRECVNCPDESAWQLIIGWLVMAFHPNGPYPVLLVNGEQGSAKSSLCRMLRQLIDPNQADLRRPPSDDRELMIDAANSWVLAFDNLSGINAKLSDALCCIATGGGFAARELYTDDSQKIFNATRPILMNGIDDIASRPDLLSRALCVTLPVISDERRRDEDEIWKWFYGKRARILGVLLDAVSCALREFPTIKLPGMPRMADFAKRVAAAEPALGWEPGTFLKAYSGNQADIVGDTIEASAVGLALMGFMKFRQTWSGTATELLTELSADNYSSDATRRRRDWPRNARAMGSALRRIEPSLRDVGIVASRSREAGGTRTRIIQIENLRFDSSLSSRSSPLPAEGMSHSIFRDKNGTQSDSAGTQIVEGGTQADRTFRPANKPLETVQSAILDNGDDGDGSLLPMSDDWGEV
jgi:hypothetical protein